MPIGLMDFPLLTPEQAAPRRTSLTKAMESLLNASNARYNFARSAEQEAKNPYVGDTAKADLAHKILENKWYEPNIQSEIGLRGATGKHYGMEDKVTDYKLKHGLYDPEIKQTIDYFRSLGGEGNYNKSSQAENDRVNYELQRNANDLPQSPMQPMPSIEFQKPQLKLPTLAERMNMELQNSLMPEYLKPKNVPNQSIPELPANAPQQQGMQQQIPQQQMAAPQEKMIPGTNISLRDAMEAAIKHKLGIPNYDQSMRGASAKQKNLYSFINNVAAEHPEWTKDQVNQAADAYLSGDDKFPDGTPLPELGGIARQSLENVQAGNAPTALKNQYAQMDILANDLNSFDIDAISSFTGVKGKARLAAEQAKMAAGNPNVDPLARRYFTAVNQSILTMDQMRKALGTSIVPEYVYQTVGKLANPNSSIWNDPKQVKDTFEATRHVMNRNRDIMKYKIQHGVTAELPKELKYPENPSQGSSEIKSGKTTFIDSNGDEHTIDSSNLEAARKRDPGLKVK